MAKLKIKTETIATFGGIFQIMELFERLGLGRFIEPLFCNYLCGVDCLEDINMLAPQLSLHPGTLIP